MGPGRVLAALAAVVAAQPGWAQDAGPSGTWSGEYACSQGVTGLRLQIEAAGADGLRAVFEFEPVASNPRVPAGCFEMAGRYDAATGHLSLAAGRWILQPAGYVTVDLDGQLAGDALRGRVLGPLCRTFALQRTGREPLPAAAACAVQGLVASAAG